MNYEKVGDSILRKTETLEVNTDMLYDTLLARKEAFIVSRDYITAQIAELDLLIAEAVNLGLKTQVQVTAEMEAAIAAENEGKPL
jgi:hypothetical protein